MNTVQKQSCAVNFTFFSNDKNPLGSLHTVDWEGFLSWYEQFSQARMVDNKSDLPMLKLATFDNNYRNDAALDLVYGVEGDYDAGQLPPEQATKLLQEAGIEALVSTTARHTNKVPRWRVLCPLSQPVTKDKRYSFVKVLDNALGGVLAKESYKLSQSYYIGSLKTGEPVRCYRSRGKTLDMVIPWPTLAPNTSIKRTNGGRIAQNYNIAKEALFNVHPDDGDRDWWLSISGAFYTATEGKGFDDWLLWNRQYQKDHLSTYNERTDLNVWNSFKKDGTSGDFLTLAEMSGYELAIPWALFGGIEHKVPVAQAVVGCKKIPTPQDNGDHLSLANTVIESLGFKNILTTSSHTWRWDKSGIWRAICDTELKQIIQNSFKSSNYPVKAPTVRAVLDVLKTELFASEHEWNLKRNIINVKNGELAWNNASWVLTPHCREHYQTTQVPVFYHSQAICTRFIKFLNEIFQNDSDGKQKAQALLEMIGYTLVSNADLERFVLLVGSGANGKSVLLDVVRSLAGKNNVCAVQPSQFGNKFQRAHLYSKLANLVTEIPEGGTIADAELKAIVSGELTTAEHKNQNPFDFQPFCTCWFGTNHLPHTRDFSDALFRRALVIPFNRTFKAGVNADPHLKSKLLEELPGIMNLGLQAFGEVLKCGTFTEPQSCLDAKEAWRIEADQAAQFLNDKCVIDPSKEISSAQLFQAYSLWACQAGIKKKLNRQNFTKRIERLGGETFRTNSARMIAGIGLI